MLEEIQRSCGGVSGLLGLETVKTQHVVRALASSSMQRETGIQIHHREPPGTKESPLKAQL